MKWFVTSIRREFEKVVFYILDCSFLYEPPLNVIKNVIINFLFGSAISKKCLLLNNVRIFFPKNLTVGRLSSILYGTVIEARATITIGAMVTIGPHVFITTGNHQTSNLTPYSKAIEIGDGVFVGARAVILPGIKIGEHSIVGAGAVVAKDVPPYAIVAGNPAKIIGTRNPTEIWTVFGTEKKDR